MAKLVSRVGSSEQGDKPPGSNHLLLPGFWLLAKNTWELQTLALPRASRLELWTLDPPGPGDAESETHLWEQLSSSFSGAQRTY